MNPHSNPGGVAAHNTPGAPMSPRSTTENQLADNVTTISRQLLDSFAFNQVDNLVGDLAHMRKYLVSKLPDPEGRSLEIDSNGGNLAAESDPARRTTLEFKGAIYARRCLSTQKVILEYLLGRCLQQCQTCLEELQSTRIASQQVEASTDYIVRHGQARGVQLDTDALDAESANLFRMVRGELFELAEELRFLDGSREVTGQFYEDPTSVLRPP